jgi:hypothetical protein
MNNTTQSDDGPCHSPLRLELTKTEIASTEELTENHVLTQVELHQASIVRAIIILEFAQLQHQKLCVMGGTRCMSTCVESPTLRPLASLSPIHTCSFYFHHFTAWELELSKVHAEISISANSNPTTNASALTTIRQQAAAFLPARLQTLP